MIDEVQSFLEAYPPRVRELVLGAPELLLRVVPNAEEKVHRPWKTIAYGLSQKFCAISPYRSWVNLHFHRGHRCQTRRVFLRAPGRARVTSRSLLLPISGRRALAGLIRTASREAE